MSDSGGIQEEASILKKKIIILRDNTERQDILKNFGILVGSNRKLIIKHTLESLKNKKKLHGAFFAGLNVFKLKLATVSKRPYI